MKILLVEDDRDLAFITKMQLEKRGYQVACAYDGAETKSHMEREEVDIVLLDMILPDCMGTELCIFIREKFYGPIIFMSCLSERESVISALKLGGDDYVIKPVDYDEVAARIEANLRRSLSTDGKNKNKTGERAYAHFVLDRNRRRGWKLLENGSRGNEIVLSPTEYKLLEIFTENPEKLLLYHELYQYVWGCDDLGDVRTVMVHVSNLRKKIDENNFDMIHTVRSAGYIFSD